MENYNDCILYLEIPTYEKGIVWSYSINNWCNDVSPVKWPCPAPYHQPCPVAPSSGEGKRLWFAADGEEGYRRGPSLQILMPRNSHFLVPEFCQWRAWVRKETDRKAKYILPSLIHLKVQGCSSKNLRTVRANQAISGMFNVPKLLYLHYFYSPGTGNVFKTLEAK